MATTADPTVEPTSPGPGPLWDDSDLARMLKITPAGVRMMRSRKKGPPWIRVGRRVLYRPADVERWLVKNRQR